MADPVSKFIDIVSVVLLDIKKYYVGDANIERLVKKFQVARQELPIKVFNDIGKILAKYTDEIIELSESCNFSTFLTRDIAEIDKAPESAQVLITLIKDYAAQLNKDKQERYAKYLYDLLDLYLSSI